MDCFTRKPSTRRAWSRGDLLFLIVIVASLVVVVIFKSNQKPAEMPAAFEQNMSLVSATLRSQETGKPVLVFATASWCGPCQSFKRGALSDPEVISFITENTEPVYMDIDEYAAEASMLGVNTVPTLIVIKDGKPVAQNSGVMGASRTISWIKDATE